MLLDLLFMIAVTVVSHPPPGQPCIVAATIVVILMIGENNRIISTQLCTHVVPRLGVLDLQFHEAYQFVAAISELIPIPLVGQENQPSLPWQQVPFDG
jgi:hypothetical protein